MQPSVGHDRQGKATLTAKQLGELLSVGQGAEARPIALRMPQAATRATTPLCVLFVRFLINRLRVQARNTVSARK